MSAITTEVISRLEALGYKARICSVNRVAELKTEFTALVDQGLIDSQVYQDAMSHLSFEPEETLAGAQSVLVIATPHRTSMVNFEYQGQTHPLVIPPIYVAGETYKQVRSLMETLSSELDFAYKYAQLPQKQLAVKSGLASYGRNNISYVPGMGSCHLLFSYYIDKDLEMDQWQSARVSPACENCHICENQCPSGAIKPGRFLIHAENCLTYFNEYEHPFPKWLKPEWHNSVIGCMRCQEHCPQNEAYIKDIDHLGGFTAAETQLILDQVPFENLPVETAEKLKQISWSSIYKLLPRNIGVLLQKAPC